MAKGLRFFGTDFNNKILGGTITVSSSDNLKEFAFDGLKSTKWLTDGEGADGNAVSLEMDYGFNRTINSIYVYNTNIDDIVVSYDATGYVALVDGTNCTITKDTSGYFIHIKTDADITTSKVKITGSNTIVADLEKYVTLFYAFMELGQFEYFPKLSPTVDPFQSIFKTTSGKGFVIEQGESFNAQLVFSSHINQNDINLIESLKERKEPMYIWANGGDESIFTYKFNPYRFQDIFKVAIVKKRKPNYTKGFYKAGYNDSINFIEVT